MLGIPLRYLLKHPVISVADLAADPVEIWTTSADLRIANTAVVKDSMPIRVR
jgi:hypothetical protein